MLGGVAIESRGLVDLRYHNGCGLANAKLKRTLKVTITLRSCDSHTKVYVIGAWSVPGQSRFDVACCLGFMSLKPKYDFRGASGPCAQEIS